MKSQVKWGLALILLGLAILPLGYPYLLVYSVPMVITGTALILYRKREERIEEISKR